MEKRRSVITLVAGVLVCVSVGASYWVHTQRTTMEDLCNSRPDCTRTCDDGNTMSCNRLGYMLESGFGGERDWKTAAQRYDQACRNEDFDSCAAYAELLQSGHGLKRDPEEATNTLKRACDKGSPRACLTLSDKLRIGHSDTINAADRDRYAAEAMRLYRQRCDSGDAPSCRTLAYRMKSGDGVPKDEMQANALEERGRELGQRRCELGDVRECLRVTTSSPLASSPPSTRLRASMRTSCDLGLGMTCYLMAQSFYAENPDHPNAIADMLRACNLGVASACDAMSEKYEHGRGVAQDLATARKWLIKAVEINRRACDAGDAQGCSYLAGSYSTGRGVEPNASLSTALAAQAVEILAQDCNLGDAIHCQQAGSMLHYGLWGATKDLARATTFLKQACDYDARYGCDELADLYVHGDGVLHEEATATALRRKACDAEEASACFAIGETTRGIKLYETQCADGNSASCGTLSKRYTNGDGVAIDLQKAAVFRGKACLLGGGSNCPN